MPDPELVQFLNGSGQLLHGSLHHPPEGIPRKCTAVILISPGVKMRVGPGRLYVPLTELLNEEGYCVLRFDVFGLGDSEGELDEKLLADIYNHIEVGRYVDDVRAALNWLAGRLRVDSFLLGGRCGGAITAVLTAENDPRVIGILSLGMTVTLASAAASPGKYLTRAQLDQRRKGYWKKLLKLRSLWRFASGQSEYSVIFRSLFRLILRDKPILDSAGKAGVSEAPAARGNANPLFPKAFFALLGRGVQVLLIFSEKDRLYYEYEEKFAQPFHSRVAGHARLIRLHVIPASNHVIALPEWRRQMLEVSQQWLQERSFA